MSTNHARLTIRRLMIAIAACAGTLAIYRSINPRLIWPLMILLVPGIGLGFIAGRLTRRRRRAAAWGFAASGMICCIAVGAICVYWMSSGGIALMVLITAWLAPVSFGFGSSYATRTDGPDSAGSPAMNLDWLAVIAACILPITMVLKAWPLHLAFRISAPSMNHLADRIASGVHLDFPQWAGIYRVVAASQSSRNGNVALFLDDHPGGPSGFVRFSSPDRFAPILGTDYFVDLGNQWSFLSED